MTKIKTAQAWGPNVKRSGSVSVTPMCASPRGNLVPVVIVHGLTEAEVHEAAELLEKSREVCRWTFYVDKDCKIYHPKHNESCMAFFHSDMPPARCPSCGRKVVVK